MTTASAAKTQVFVISPIGDDRSPTREAADKVLKHLIRRGLGSAFEVERADDDSNPGAITPRMVTAILEADLIIADLTGANPNVFYEVAIAHGFRKPTVHIQKADEPLPFDVKDMRTVKYDVSDPDELEKAQKLLRDYANYALSSPDQLVTPLSSAQRFVSVQTSKDPLVESNVQVLEAVSSLSEDVRRVLRRVAPVRRMPGGESLNRVKADRSSLTNIVKQAADAGRLEPLDFRHAITNETTDGFDDYMRRQLGSIMKTEDLGLLNPILMHPDLLEEEEEE